MTRWWWGQPGSGDPAGSGGAVPKIENAPWPAFPADVLSIPALVVATQAHGTVLIHDKMFEPAVFH